MEIIQNRLTEGSTAIFTCTFEDENGDAETPVSDVEWTVRTADGTQVSSGSETAAATVNIVIKGSELSAPAESGDSQILTLIVSTTYNSSLGNGFPLKKIMKFALDNEPGTP